MTIKRCPAGLHSAAHGDVLIFDSTVGVDGAWVVCAPAEVDAANVLNPTLVVGNSTTKTAIITATIPANTLAAGRTFEIVVFGYFARAGSATAVSLTFTSELNGSVLGTFGPAATSTANPTRCEVITRHYLSCLTSGAGGTSSLVGTIKQNLALATNPLDENTFDGGYAIAIDTTVANTLTISAQFSAAVAGTSFVCNRAFLRRVL